MKPNKRSESAPEVTELDEFVEVEKPERPAGQRRPASEVAQDQPPRREREAGLTGGAIPGRSSTDDDLTPDSVIREDGARSPHEPGSGGPNDAKLSEVSVDDIGAGGGLDEEELAHVDPLDGEPWDDEDETR